MKNYKITIAGRSETGDRERNEDSYQYLEKENAVYICVADGLGGHSSGDVASRLAAETSIRCMTEFYPQVPDFRQVYDEVQKALIEKQTEMGISGGMLTTMNLLYIGNDSVQWNHVGDSRTYYFSGRELVKRTLDHSMPQVLVDLGEIKEEEIRFSDERSRLLRVMGSTVKYPNVDMEEPIALSGSQQFLLCTDGFWEMINETQMEWCLEDADSPEMWLNNMFALAHHNARDMSEDNMTAVCIWIEEE